MGAALRVAAGLFLSAWLMGQTGSGGTAGRAALEAFQAWKQQPDNASLEWGEALDSYRKTLTSQGSSDEQAEVRMQLIIAYDEAELYNRVYSEPAEFNTGPNQFLIEAVAGVTPGTALDAGMGQGRNSIYLARKGWKVTGFDVAETGLGKARERAAELGLSITTVHAADIEFEFGHEQWDLIVIIHAMEKRSVHRVARALKPGGIVVIEASHKEPGGYIYGYESNELLRTFDSLRILRYEETLGSHDFSQDRNRKELLVRLIAQKPRWSAPAGR